MKSLWSCWAAGEGHRFLSSLSLQFFLSTSLALSQGIRAKPFSVISQKCNKTGGKEAGASAAELAAAGAPRAGGDSP